MTKYYHLDRTLADFAIQRRPSGDLFSWVGEFSDTLQHFSDNGYNMYQRVVRSPNTNRVVVEDPISGREREMIMMGNNSYLGLHVHPRVIEAAKAAIDRYGAGAASPPHFSGYYDIHRKLENKLAFLKGTESAILYPSGYSTNLGLLSCFLGGADTVVID